MVWSQRINYFELHHISPANVVARGLVASRMATVILNPL
jgi:hypothetical protein